MVQGAVAPTVSFNETDLVRWFCWCICWACCIYVCYVPSAVVSTELTTHLWITTSLSVTAWFSQYVRSAPIVTVGFGAKSIRTSSEVGAQVASPLAVSVSVTKPFCISAILGI